MILLHDDTLVFRFPEVHPDATLGIDFQRTLRIPDDDGTYPLPPGLGRFPLRHVDDHASRLPDRWLTHGGVMLPMYQAEAMWLNFSRHGGYPFAIKVAAGKINAVTGAGWDADLHRGPQDYLVVPTQPWLDGYCITKGVIRQFVAMPLGAGYTAEEQLTGEAEYGGVQIVAFPMKREAYERRRPSRVTGTGVAMSLAVASPARPAADMGLAPGGRMQQHIYDDPYDFTDWDLDHSSRCFVHIANSMVWSDITGSPPPTVPPTAREYTKAGLPWFDYYDETATAVPGSKRLGQLQSVAQKGAEKSDVPLPENATVSVDRVIELRKKRQRGEVREGTF